MARPKPGSKNEWKTCIECNLLLRETSFRFYIYEGEKRRIKHCKRCAKKRKEEKETVLTAKKLASLNSSPARDIYELI